MVKFRKKTRRKFKKKGGTRYLCSEVKKQNPTLKEPNIEYSIPSGPRQTQGKLRPLASPRKPGRKRPNPYKTEIQGQPKRTSEIQLAKSEDTGLAGPFNPLSSSLDPPKMISSIRESSDSESDSKKRELGLLGSPTGTIKKGKTGTEKEEKEYENYDDIVW